MRKNLNYLKLSAAFIALAVCAMLGMILPNKLFSASDRRRMEAYKENETKPLVVNATGQISLDQKLNLLYNLYKWVGDEGVRILPVAAEKEEVRAVRKNAREELKKLNEAKALPRRIRFLRKEKIESDNIKKYLVIDTQEPGMLMYIWTVMIVGQDDHAGTIMLAIEDDSGIVVAMDAYSDVREDWKKMRKGFSSYLRPESDRYEKYLKKIAAAYGGFLDEEMFTYADGRGGVTGDPSRLAFCFSSIYNLEEGYSDSTTRLY